MHSETGILHVKKGSWNLAIAELMNATQARPARPLQEKLLSSARLPWPVIIYVLAVVLPIGFQAGPLALSALRLFLLVMTVPLMVQLLMGRYGRIFVTDILFVLHVLWAAVSLAVNNPDQVIEQVGSVGMEFLGGYAVGRAYIRTPESFVALARFLSLVILCMLPFALYEAATNRPLILEALRKLPGVSTPATVNAPGRMGMERVQASFSHPIHWGLFCSVTFSLSFVALNGVSSTFWRFTSSAIVAFCGFLALSSGALLALVLQFGLIAWAVVFDRLRWRWWLLFGLFVLAYIVVDLLSNRTPIQVFMSYATFSAHTAYWRSIIFDYGMQNVWANPIFGLGLNDWFRPWYMNSGSMDNFWLVMAVRYGIPGFLFVTIGFILPIVHIMRRDLERDAMLSQIRRAWIFTFLGLSFTLCTVHVWTNIYSFVFFMFGAGIWLITAQPQDRDSVGTAMGGGLHGLRSVTSGGLRSDTGNTASRPPRSLPHTRFPQTPADPHRIRRVAEKIPLNNPGTDHDRRNEKPIPEASGQNSFRPDPRAR